MSRLGVGRLSVHMKLSRRQFIAGLAGVATAACAVPAYARWIEPRWLSIDRVTIPFFSATVPHPLRVLHLSDFHLSRVVPLTLIERAVRVGIAGQPDLAVITGDLITKELHQHNAYVRVLRELTDRMPVYAVLGNHDGGRWARARGGYPDTHAVRGLFAHSGIHLLHNASVPVRHGDRTLWLIGVGDLWADEMDAEQAFRDVPGTASTGRILLAHNPDSKDALGDRNWELMLSGHTHGGQVALPFLGTPMAPVRDHRYVSGLNRWRDRWIYTTRGVGNLHGIRFNCRPEISLLELTEATRS